MTAAFRCPACGRILLEDEKQISEDIRCTCGVLVSLCEHCGRAYNALETGVDGHCLECSDERFPDRA